MKNRGKPFHKFGFKFLFKLLFLWIAVKNTEANHDIAFYPTKKIGCFLHKLSPMET